MAMDGVLHIMGLSDLVLPLSPFDKLELHLGTGFDLYCRRLQLYHGHLRDHGIRAPWVIWDHELSSRQGKVANDCFRLQVFEEIKRSRDLQRAQQLTKKRKNQSMSA